MKNDSGITCPRPEASDLESEPAAPDDAGNSPNGIAAWHPDTSAESLRRLATDPDRTIRLGVAGHANAPSDAVTRLASDPDRSVRHAVAANTSANAGCSDCSPRTPNSWCAWPSRATPRRRRRHW